MNDRIEKYAKSENYAGIIREMLMEAEENKRGNVDKDYWQGRADALRIVMALLFNGLNFGLRSGKSAEKFTDLDHDVIDFLVSKK